MWIHTTKTCLNVVKNDQTQLKVINNLNNVTHSEEQEKRRAEVEKGGSALHILLGKSFGLHTAAPKVDRTSGSEQIKRERYKS